MTTVKQPIPIIIILTDTDYQCTSSSNAHYNIEISMRIQTFQQTESLMPYSS